MKKYLLVLLCLFVCMSCGSREDKVKKVFEDGVDVVLNHLEPYKLKGEPAAVNLVKEFVIDTEKDELVDIGFYQPNTFDVDSDGNIYFIQWESNGNYIFKFDNNGCLITSFC